jgi:hypothetical protein
VDRITRKELKSDWFASKVQHGVEYGTDHRRQVLRWGAIALAAAVVILAVFFYRQHQHTVRQEELRAALRLNDAVVGGQSSEFLIAFPTQAEKDKAVTKALSDVAARHSGTDEGMIAEYVLASNAADKGDIAQAEKRFKLVADSGPAAYAAFSKLALAQIYGSNGKLADGKKLIQSVIDHPSVTVSKEQATIAMARLIAPTDPQGARKMLEPLRANERSPVSRAALSALSELPK